MEGVGGLSKLLAQLVVLFLSPFFTLQVCVPLLCKQAVITITDSDLAQTHLTISDIW